MKAKALGRLNTLGGFAFGYVLGFTSLLPLHFNLSSFKLTGSEPAHPAGPVCADTSLPQVFNFIKELQCRDEGHMGVPKLLKRDGRGKVVVDVGLDQGDEFFAALEAGYSVYGFEANPTSILSLKQKCSNVTNCNYVNAKDIAGPLPPIQNGGYLIEGGAGATKGFIQMSLAGPGSSFVEVAPGVNKASFKNVTIIPISHVVANDVYFFKLDVQGFEFEVLKGAQDLFINHRVKTLMMEVYPRGLKKAGVDFLEFLNFTWHDLGLFCSSSIDGNPGFILDHANTLLDLSKYLENESNTTMAQKWWGAFDDFYCFNRRKAWI